MHSNITVVIRSSGERTLTVCHNLVAQQVPLQNINVISERPFNKAIKRTFEIGIDNKLPWTLAIDADVLIQKNSISKLVKFAEQADTNIFEIQGQILDKLFCGPRPAGNHLFRTRYLSKALSCIPDEGESLRPESYVLKAMSTHGHPWFQVDTIIGLHDHEQYFRDIYRKAFVHANKHNGTLAPYLTALWKHMAETDPDFRVALWGWRAGVAFDGTVRLDTNAFPQDIDVLLKMQGWQEKDGLAANAWSENEIVEFIQDFQAPPEFKQIQRAMSGVKPPKDWNKSFQAAFKKTGWARIFPWSVGWGLKQMGHVLQSWSEG